MTTRGLRRLWFLGLWLMLPWPLVVFSDGFVPAVRYAILATATTLLAVTEGAGGPVGMIMGLFVGYAVATTLCCWVLAWGISRMLARLPAATGRNVSLAVLGAGLIVSLLFEPYTTPFGRGLHGGLLQVLS